jgi:hypothetical protein
MNYDKESALETAIKYIREGMEDASTEMCLIIANTETGNMRIIGMNMPEEEVPLLLTAAAEEMSEAVLNMYENRTVN